VITTGLPALADGKVYELWFLTPGAARPAGLRPARAVGRTAPFLASWLARG